MSRKRKAPQGGSGGHDGAGMMRWLLTYADLITLLMAFFVVLYSMSQLDQAKYQQLAASLSLFLNGEPSGNSLIEITPTASAPPKMMPNSTADSHIQQEAAHLAGLARQIRQWAEAQGISGQVELSLQGRGLVVSVTDAIFFDEASAVIRPEARDLIRKLVPILQQTDHQIEVLGSTDDQPLHSPIYPTAWELSTARATQVVRFLTSLGIPPERLIATGLGEWHPRYPNDSDENRARNRRVDVVILRDSAAVPGTMDEGDGGAR